MMQLGTMVKSKKGTDRDEMLKAAGITDHKITAEEIVTMKANLSLS